jgi:hypothetical protein
MSTDTKLDPNELTDWRLPADRLQLKKKPFDALRAEGLPFYKLNQRVFRYRWSEIERWLGERRKGGN